MKLANYSKGIASAVGSALTFASLYYGSNHWVSAAVAVASTLGVVGVANVKPADAGTLTIAHNRPALEQIIRDVMSAVKTEEELAKRPGANPAAPPPAFPAPGTNLTPGILPPRT